MARPAGYSSDECSDDDDDGLSCSINNSRRTFRAPVPENGNSSKEEKLIEAILDGQLEEVKRILNNKVSINHQSSKFKNWTPLMHACYEGNSDIIKVLLENGASITSHCNLLTPLLCLCDSRNPDEDELIKSLDILIQHGADIHALDWYKESAVVYAVRRSYGKLVFELLSRGCKLESTDSLGWTPVFHAVNSGNLAVVKILKEAGADMTKQDNSGYKLHEIALNKNYQDIFDYIIPSSDSDNKNSIIPYKSEGIMNSCDYILLEQPNILKGELYGYHSDTIHWISGVGLESLVELFVEKNIQLNEILTMTDEKELEEIGVRISFDRKKILYCVQKFHEASWSKNSLPQINDEKSIDLCEIANLLSTVLFHLHVSNAAALFWKKKKNGLTPSQAEMSYVIKTMKYIQLLQKETKDILEFVKEVEKNDAIIPPDLIQPKQVQGSSKYKFLIIPVVFVCLIKLVQPNFLSILPKPKFKLW